MRQIENISSSTDRVRRVVFRKLAKNDGTTFPRSNIDEGIAGESIFERISGQIGQPLSQTKLTNGHRKVLRRSIGKTYRNKRSFARFISIKSLRSRVSCADTHAGAAYAHTDRRSEAAHWTNSEGASDSHSAHQHCRAIARIHAPYRRGSYSMQGYRDLSRSPLSSCASRPRFSTSPRLPRSIIAIGFVDVFILIGIELIILIE